MEKFDIVIQVPVMPAEATYAASSSGRDSPVHLNMDTVGRMPCSPPSAYRKRATWSGDRRLGGIMAEAADETAIQ